MKPRYRAWDKEENRWINIASLVFDEEGELWYLSPVMDDFNPVYYENELGKTWEIMQSTGLKDKNGVEIFEGDVVVNQYGNVGYVAYLQQEAGFVVVLKKSDYRLGHRNTGESYDVTTNHEVIGNIHSNPELLERANEN
ncbi:YopX family protein [Enterococcus casseliflavus]|uniref:YopX family protein n=1 Tax=Enterococcus casseliflavus TaxID=37734 RepID=UPI002FDC4178